MSFLETVRRAKAYLEEQGRVSLDALALEFGLDAARVETLVEELVGVLRVAVREGKVLVWVGRRAANPPPAQVRREERTPLHYTPKHLADKILQSKSALEGERKWVTVLFADVKGSMELAEQVDPEQWHNILDRFFQILAEGVHRFEGTINQYTGDGIMALFGAPIAHEDHAQRACYAVLYLQQELASYATKVKREHALGFSTRMGMHSGEVVVGKIGDDLRMDYTAQGHTVGLAQRMEALASPDTCYLTGATAALASGYFAFEDMGDFAVRGKSAPVRVHRLVGTGAARTRFDISRARGLTSFVGRDADMATLEAALETARAGDGQVVGVVAEAGTGKSRLCFEFVERCRARGMTVNEGHAVPHGKNVPYLPMLQVFRNYYGIGDQDDDRTVREKIAGRMLLLDEGFRDVLPVLFEFFGVPDPNRLVARMDPDAKQRQLFGVLRRVLKGTDRQGGARNVVTLIEDLHWFDPGSEAFLEEWVAAIGGAPSLLLVNFRPEYRAEWMRKSYYRQLPLAPLGAAAIRALADDLLGADPSVEGLATLVHSRSGGNPFFAEEIVQSLIESGALEGTPGNYRMHAPLDMLEIPATVQSILAARIDRLSEREKPVLQTAAVIGREFAEPILLAASNLPDAEVRAALAVLKANEFVFEQALYPIAEYAFKHALTQEVALGSQLQEQQRHRHAAVARAIEATHADKLDEQAALLAHHWEAADEALVAARWHRRAAEWVGRSNPVQGVAHMQRVLALTDRLDTASEERSELRFEACRNLLVREGWRVGLSLDDVESLFAEGRELAARAGDVDKAIGLYVGYAVMLGFGGHLRRQYEVARDAASLLDESVSPGPAAVALLVLSVSSFCVGRIREALEFAERITGLVEGDESAGVETSGFSAWGWSLSRRADYMGLLGRLDDARAMAREAIHLARSRGLSEPLAWSLGASVDIADYSGQTGANADEARRHALETVAIAERIGSHLSRIQAGRALGVAHMLHGDWDDAAKTLEGTLAVARQQRTGLEREAHFLAYLSRAYLGKNDGSRARAMAEECVTRAQAQGARYFECRGQLALARALGSDRGASACDEIERCLDRALELVGEAGARVVEPRVIEERARLAQLRGDRAAASTELRGAHSLYVEVGATGHAARLAAELGSSNLY